MQWFKHYSNVSESNILNKIEAEFGLEGYARYFKLLELLARKFDGTSDEHFVIITPTLMAHLRIYHFNVLRMFLECLHNVGIMSVKCDKRLCEISTPILLELQSRDFKSARLERASTAPKNKIENKSKIKIKIKNNINTISTELKNSDSAPAENIINLNSKFKKPTQVELDSFDTPDSIINALPFDVKERWVGLYQDKEFLQREAIKAFGYYAQDNPKKKPKSIRGWTRALSYWFERAWTYQAKNTKGISEKEKQEIQSEKFWEEFLKGDDKSC